MCLANRINNKEKEIKSDIKTVKLKLIQGVLKGIDRDKVEI